MLVFGLGSADGKKRYSGDGFGQIHIAKEVTTTTFEFKSSSTKHSKDLYLLCTFSFNSFLEQLPLRYGQGLFE